MSPLEVNTKSGILVCWLVDEYCSLYAENMEKNFIHCLVTKRKNPEIFWNFSSLNREKKDTVGFTQVHVCIRGHHNWSSWKMFLEIWIVEKCNLWVSFMNFVAKWAAQVYTNTISYFEVALR